MSLGTDISALPDLDFTIRSGTKMLAEAIARRLMTPRGGLFYDPTYGLDVRAWLHERVTPAALFELEALVAGEVEADERVQEAEVKADVLGPRSFRLTIRGRTADGPFRLVLNVTQVRVEVLYGDA